MILNKDPDYKDFVNLISIYKFVAIRIISIGLTK